MTETEEFIAHYASEFYDPAKAHEYYLKNRELKKRSIGQLRGKKKKETFAYVAKQIGQKKHAESKALAETRRLQAEKVRKGVSERQKVLSEKLKVLLKGQTQSRQLDAKQIAEQQKGQAQRLTETQKRESKRISDEAQAKIDAIPAIPKGVTKERRAELSSQRNAEIAKIRGDAASQKTALTTDTKSGRGALATQAKGDRQALTTQGKQDSKQQREDVAKEREKIKGELKGSVAKARANYQTLRDNLKQKYEQTLNKEFEAVKRG